MQMPEFLTKHYGPVPGWAIVAGGIAVGVWFMWRKRKPAQVQAGANPLAQSTETGGVGGPPFVGNPTQLNQPPPNEPPMPVSNPTQPPLPSSPPVSNPYGDIINFDRWGNSIHQFTSPLTGENIGMVYAPGFNPQAGDLLAVARSRQIAGAYQPTTMPAGHAGNGLDIPPSAAPVPPIVGGQ